MGKKVKIRVVKDFKVEARDIVYADKFTFHNLLDNEVTLNIEETREVKNSHILDELKTIIDECPEYTLNIKTSQGLIGMIPKESTASISVVNKEELMNRLSEVCNAEDQT